VYGTGLFDPCLCRSHIRDFNAEVVQAGVPGRSLSRGRVVVLNFKIARLTWPSLR
jgi:hypothetical protein